MTAERAASLTLGDRRREVAAVLRTVELHGPLTGGGWYATVELGVGLRWSSAVCRTPRAAIRELAGALDHLGADEADL